jgi:hypothetical protein
MSLCARKAQLDNLTLRERNDVVKIFFKAIGFLIASMVIISPIQPPVVPMILEHEAPKIIIPAIQAPMVSQEPIGVQVAYAKQSNIDVFSQPGGLLTQTLNQEGITYHPDNKLTFLVLKDQGDWLEVMLPVRPNESTGWIRFSDVTLGRVYTEVTVDLSDRELCVNTSPATIEICFPVAIGTIENPTPVGHFFVESWLSVTANPVFGPYQLILSAYSDTETTFMGGNGVIGAHGTNQPELIGTEASHGCVRLNNADITKLIKLGVQPGTPFIIQP